MFPNPGPAIKAAGRADALPAFLFSHPMTAGFFGMVMLSVFGAAAASFFSLVEPGMGSVDLFEAGRAGAIVAVMLGVIIYSGVFISALFLPEERTVRLLFVLGGAIGLGALVALDLYVADTIRAWLVGDGLKAG